MNADAFKTVEREINAATFVISRFERALEKLVTPGPVAYNEEVTHDERRDPDRHIDLLDDLMAASKSLEAELEAPQRALETTRGSLSPEQEARRKRIADLETKVELDPFEYDYRNKKQDFDKIKTQVDGLFGDVKEGIHVGAAIVQHMQVTTLVKDGIPEIKEIKVRASSAALAKYGQLTLEITVR